MARVSSEYEDLTVTEVSISRCSVREVVATVKCVAPNYPSQAFRRESRKGDCRSVLERIEQKLTVMSLQVCAQIAGECELLVAEAAAVRFVT